MATNRPSVGAHRPYVPGRAPAGRPNKKPKWRVVVHRKYLDIWEQLDSRIGSTNAQQLWDYLTTQPDRQSPYGCVSRMRGLPKGAKKVWHYEVTGAGRVDFYYEPEFIATPGQPPHPTVFVIGIDLGSH